MGSPGYGNRPRRQCILCSTGRFVIAIPMVGRADCRTCSRRRGTFEGDDHAQEAVQGASQPFPLSGATLKVLFLRSSVYTVRLLALPTDFVTCQEILSFVIFAELRRNGPLFSLARTSL